MKYFAAFLAILALLGVAATLLIAQHFGSASPPAGPDCDKICANYGDTYCPNANPDSLTLYRDHQCLCCH